MREDDGVELLFERKDFLRERFNLRARHGLAELKVIRVDLDFCDICHKKMLLPENGSVNPLATDVLYTREKFGANVRGSTFPAGLTARLRGIRLWTGWTPQLQR